MIGDLLHGEGGDLAVVEAGGEDAGLVYPDHLGGDQAPAGVGQQVLRPHPGPEGGQHQHQHTDKV